MKTRTIKKLLIANRGEIAVRIIRTCREMGIATVAVYSQADAHALFVRLADEAYEIGPALASESYLCIDKIMAVAKQAKVDAIHPGYGFLSERAAFSEACEKNGICFVGPTPKAISAMGDKVSARLWAEKAKVPMVPGTKDPVKGLEQLKEQASEIGFPLLIKASAGGGGKGMRVVSSADELEQAFERAQSESLKAFGDDRVYLEKYIQTPRHVEIQILCDQHGHGVFLFERECSVQRRHQKVIEEAPYVDLKDSVRQAMGEAALNLAAAIDYHGAGTVEFLVDHEQSFYFLEMNTRLQVEHPVTEMITGLDLVRLQIDVARGETLSLAQQDIECRGHAIECRVYAEDPRQGFLPSPGQVVFLQAAEGPGVRHDSGVVSGSVIPAEYDPMVAKLVVHAATREQAIVKMQQALKDYKLLGVTHNIPFLQTILNTKEFLDGDLHTQFLDKHPELCTQEAKDALPLELVLVAAAACQDYKKTSPNHDRVSESPWWLAGVDEGVS